MSSKNKPLVEKIGPYRVYEQLGVGGMGEVFKAYDDRLDRWVAIKRIRGDREDDADNRERFKREARATARLNHPSIVHLYGIFQDGDSDCIVMEFVDGETLDKILARGVLDPIRAAAIGHEIAAGLSEAHANGILHRDLKAENIIFTPRGRVKILDFGLAKPILHNELDPALTDKGQLVGTSRAMSPEYVSGEDVDHRSDLFSLGVLLYECLTGHSPFKAQNTLGTLKQVMMHKQTPVRVLNPNVPQELSDLIEQLLEKEPDDRPQNAHEVSVAFGRLSGQVSSGIVDIPGGLPTSSLSGTSTTTGAFTASETRLDLRNRYHWIAIASVVVILVAGAFFLGQLLTEPAIEEPEIPPEERIFVVLADFENNTDEPNLGASLYRALRAILDQSSSSTVLSRGQARDALRRMQVDPDSEVSRSLAVEIGRREGAARIIVSSVSKFGNSYSMVLEVVEPQADQTVFSFSDSSKNSAGLLSDLELGALQIRAHLGDSVAEIEQAIPLAKVVTPDFEALKAYTLGLQKVESNRDQEAISFFKRALELDPGFAMAHAKLGVVYSNLRRREEGLHHLESAEKLPDRLTEIESFYVEAWLARWKGRPSDVVDSWASMCQLHPESHAAAYNLGQALWFYHLDFEGAALAFEQAVEESRGSVRDTARGVLALAYIGLNRFVDAAAVLDQIREGSSNASEPASSMLRILEGRRVDVSAYPQSVPWQGEDERFLFLALAEAASGNLDSAATSIQVLLDDPEFETSETSQLHALIDLASIYNELGHDGRFQEAIAEALERGRALLRPSTIRFESGTASLFALIGKMLARRGNLQKAQEIAQELEATVASSDFRLWNLYLHVLEAEILLAEGRSAESQSLLVEALRTTVSFQASESLAFARKGDESAIQELNNSKGLMMVEAGSSTYGRMYALLLAKKYPILFSPSSEPSKN